MCQTEKDLHIFHCTKDKCAIILELSTESRSQVVCIHLVQLVEGIKPLLQYLNGFVDLSIIRITWGQVNVLLEVIDTQLTQSYLTIRQPHCHWPIRRQPR